VLVTINQDSDPVKIINLIDLHASSCLEKNCSKKPEKTQRLIRNAPKKSKLIPHNTKIIGKNKNYRNARSVPPAQKKSLSSVSIQL
jgi:hypothetical protein